MKTKTITGDGRAALLRVAKKRIPSADAEDAVHDAVLKALEKKATDATSFAGGVLKNLVRRRPRKTPRIPELEQPGVEGLDTVLATATNVARLDAAIEHVLSPFAGMGGTTSVIVPSVSDFDVLRVLVEFQALLEALDLLPFSKRHRRRLRESFINAIKSAWNNCAVETEVHSVESLDSDEDIADGPDAEPAVSAPENVHAGQQRVTVLFFDDGALQRAFVLLQQAAPKLSMEDHLELAAEAVRCAAVRVDQEVR